MSTKKTDSPKTEAQEAQETNVTTTKTVKAVFAEDTYSSSGKFSRGMTYEIPEESFAAWEKAGLCKAAK